MRRYDVVQNRIYDSVTGQSRKRIYDDGDANLQVISLKQPLRRMPPVSQPANRKCGFTTTRKTAFTTSRIYDLSGSIPA